MKQRLYTLISAIILLSGFMYPGNKGVQKAFYRCTDPLEIDHKLFEIRDGQTYFYFDKTKKPDKLNEGNLLGLSDTLGYFTAYLVNTSDSVFNAERQDGSLIMIQEAKDQDGRWKPIEYWVYSGCGNSYFNPLQLAPGKYVMVPVKEYRGDFKTDLRLKMHTGDAIFYSGVFEGCISKSQFEKETGNVNGILYHGPASYLD